MADNYPVDMNAAKNSILFKKFIQGRNKSYTSTTPKMSDVKVTLK